MSGLEAVGLLTAVVPIAVSILTAYTTYFSSSLERFHKDSYPRKRFGRLNTLLLTLFLAHPSRLGSFEWDLNSWADADVLTWKTSYLGGCNITAATSAIIAQVAITALSLLDLNDTHWTARAMMTIATVLGIMSVLIASSQSVLIGQLNSALEIRVWLSDEYDPQAFQGAPAQTAQELYGTGFKLPLRCSLAAQRLIDLPFSLLNLAGACFLAGFGVYLGSAWSNHLSTNIGNQDNRNVLIAFILSASLPLVIWATWSVLKMQERGYIEKRSAHSMAFLLKAELHNNLRRSLEPVQHLRTSIFGTAVHAQADHGVPNIHQPRPAHGTDIEMPEIPVPPSTTSELTKVLQEAAAAQRKCAEACLAVAAEYERLSWAEPPPLHEMLRRPNFGGVNTA